MSALFKKTRLAGPADHQRYDDALSAYKDLNGSCAKVEGAPAKVAGKLSNCRDRAQAQKPVLAAGADGMADWKSHLAAMQRNAEEPRPQRSGRLARRLAGRPAAHQGLQEGRRGFRRPEVLTAGYPRALSLRASAVESLERLDKLAASRARLDRRDRRASAAARR